MRSPATPPIEAPTLIAVLWFKDDGAGMILGESDGDALEVDASVVKCEVVEVRLELELELVPVLVVVFEEVADVDDLVCKRVVVFVVVAEETEGMEAPLTIPGRRSRVGQPFRLHGFDEQQPMKGGSVNAQVYHELPVGHCWSSIKP